MVGCTLAARLAGDSCSAVLGAARVACVARLSRVPCLAPVPYLKRSKVAGSPARHDDGDNDKCNDHDHDRDHDHDSCHHDSGHDDVADRATSSDRARLARLPRVSRVTLLGSLDGRLGERAI